MEKSKIDPALTAEEWGDVLGDPMLADGDVHTVARSWIMPDPTPAQWIALANAMLPDSDPRKITREKLATIRHALDLLPRVEQDDYADYSTAEAFADALESYLPPEGA